MFETFLSRLFRVSFCGELCVIPFVLIDLNIGPAANVLCCCLLLITDNNVILSRYHTSRYAVRILTIIILIVVLLPLLLLPAQTPVRRKQGHPEVGPREETAKEPDESDTWW